MSEFEVVSLIYLIGGVIYLIPSIVAFRRRYPNRWLILVLNIVFGGTGIGWLGGLVWAFHAAHITRDPEGSNGGESGLNLVANDPVRIAFDPVPPPAHTTDCGVFVSRSLTTAPHDQAQHRKAAVQLPKYSCTDARCFDHHPHPRAERNKHL